MAILLNIGRIAMLVWVIYGLLQIFAPSVIHRAPDQTSGIVQVVAAYTLGYLLDRALGRVRRRKADLAAANSSTSGP
jgi:hypothetical protein